MDPITYGTVCSGIEAPSVAWEGLGWAPTFFSEIEAFPRQTLQQRQRAVNANQSGAATTGTPLWGDFTAMRMRFFRRLGIRLPDVLCGGTPCQAFSLAGLRQSLDDARGNLTLEYVRLANAIDNERFRLGKPGLVILWENVPGVLSTKDNVFGCFLAGLVGADTPILPPPGLRWTDAGLVAGPRRNAAWRVLDSQCFGLAQRRRRVFVVGCPVDGPDPAEILPEQEGLRRDHPPRREAQKSPAARPAGGAASDPQSLTGTPCAFVSDIAPTIPSRATAGGGMGSDFDFDGGLVAVQAFGGNNTSGPIDVATTLNASHTASGRPDFETETFVCQPAYPILEVGARTGASTSDPSWRWRGLRGGRRHRPPDHRNGRVSLDRRLLLQGSWRRRVGGRPNPPGYGAWRQPHERRWSGCCRRKPSRSGGRRKRRVGRRRDARASVWRGRG
jgi:DNA (cytosine-5)-methyltransferase 1